MLRLQFSLLAGICLMLTGCWVFEDSTTVSEESTAVVIEFPEGDPNVSAEDGGPGFTGEGWTTVEKPGAGDPNAIKGGTMTSPIPDWPKEAYIYGAGANTTHHTLLGSLLYEALLQLDPNTLQWQPLLATHWKVSEDKQTFTFRINPRAHWMDGKPVTADDVIATWELVTHKDMDDPMLPEMYGRLERPVAQSKYIVEVRSKQKDWKNFNSIASLSILPAHLLKDSESGKVEAKKYLKEYVAQFMPGSGPYQVLEGDFRDPHSLTLTRREDWWGAKEPWAVGLYNIDKLRFEAHDERLGFEKMLKSELDFKYMNVAKWWIEELNTPEFEQGYLVKQKVFSKVPRGFQGIVFNMRDELLSDIRVRKAFAHLYNRKEMLKLYAYNEYVPLKTYFYASPAENADNVLVEYDPAQAAKLLAEAGWKERGSDGILVKDKKRLSLKFLYSSPAFDRYMTHLKADCKAAGVEVILQLTDPTALFDSVNDHKFQLSRMNWSASPFPNPYMSFHSSLADQKQSNNIPGLKNKELDKLIEAYDAEFDIAKRNELLQQMDKIIFEEHPYALEWTVPCERMVFVNKFGMPESVLPKYGDYRAVFSYWWVDPAKEKTLKAAKEAGKKVEPIPPFIVRPWDEEKTVTQTP